MAEGMRAPLGQPVIIENAAGANGSIGVGRVARAAPDGYTLSFGVWNAHVANGAIYALQYDVLTDFEPITLISSYPYLIAAKKGVPANDLEGFIGWLKANPDKASMGTPGVGSPGHRARRRPLISGPHRYPFPIRPLPRSGPRDAGFGSRADRHDVG
jgi:tripartite-type tricarboxylate transporter receptor subunit TctC